MSFPATDTIAAILFLIALVHTLSTRFFDRLALKFPQHSRLLHLFGEVEVVFGFWAIVLVFIMSLTEGASKALLYAQSRSYTEPLFVFVVMVVAASKPILQVVLHTMTSLSRYLPLQPALAQAWLGFAAVPLLGSAITEPAAMTIAALLLAPLVFRQAVPEQQKYFALGVLFVNISIGGTLTSFAAPPVLMVAATWDWDSAFMLATFGWKAAIAVVINASLAVYFLRNHLHVSTKSGFEDKRTDRVPAPLVVVHLIFLTAIVFLAHHPVAFIGLFLMFLGLTKAYEQHQNPLILREALLVAFFLSGLVILGGMQQWWIEPIIANLTSIQLFWGALGLTAITDNAAITYLGSLILNISEEAKYSLVAGAVAGGGLTVIANAPNPVGVSLLKQGFNCATVGAGALLLGSLAPTLVAVAAFTLL